MKRLIETARDVWSLFVGLAITGKYFVAPKRTTYYPRETVEKAAAASFRGPIELVGLPKDPATPKCISCMLCAQACPSNCITVKKSPAPAMTPEQKKAFDEATARGENPKKPAAPKNPATYHYDFTYCSLCACCVEACPVNSIRFSHELYLAGSRREDFHIDLLARLKRTARQKPAPENVPAEKAAATEEASA
ncbi:MAG: 4Fe-4S binding protein [Deltaproteobacteria bacterium]|jgi:NADH-quinone oxidoreductase subunit I|nr:4Fe-4S binding protein [Deltaproteobacteria bacterium]